MPRVCDSKLLYPILNIGQLKFCSKSNVFNFGYQHHVSFNFDLLTSKTLNGFFFRNEAHPKFHFMNGITEFVLQQKARRAEGGGNPRRSPR